ncbi:hypothetical protein Tco_0503859 [Tanacetum coccineum]
MNGLVINNVYGRECLCHFLEYGCDNYGSSLININTACDQVEFKRISLTGFAATLAVLITGASQSRQHVLALFLTFTPFVSYLRTSILSNGMSLVIKHIQYIKRSLEYLSLAPERGDVKRHKPAKFPDLEKSLYEWILPISRTCEMKTDNMTFENSDEGGESTQELQNLIKELGYRNAMDVEDVLTHPEENVVAQLLTDEEIIESVIGINKDDIDEEDDESSTMEPPSRNEAIKAAITLNNFLLSYEKTTPEEFFEFNSRKGLLRCSDIKLLLVTLYTKLEILDSMFDDKTSCEHAKGHNQVQLCPLCRRELE